MPVRGCFWWLVAAPSGHDCLVLLKNCFTLLHTCGGTGPVRMCPVTELLLLLEDSEALTEKVDEAVAVLKQHDAIPAAE